MTKLSGEELDRLIAPIAGLVEGVDYWSKRPHQWVSPLRYARDGSIVEQCKLCGIFEDEPLTSLACHKPPPVYHESLDLIVPVVRKLNNEQEFLFLDALYKRYSENVLSKYKQSAKVAWTYFLLHSDDPARLLCEALVEAVGGENAG